MHDRDDKIFVTKNIYICVNSMRQYGNYKRNEKSNFLFEFTICPKHRIEKVYPWHVLQYHMKNKP